MFCGGVLCCEGYGGVLCCECDGGVLCCEGDGGVLWCVGDGVLWCVVVCCECVNVCVVGPLQQAGGEEEA